MTAVLDHALSYAAAGVPVFPVGADKKPLHKGGFHTATTDVSTLSAWFRASPRAGVAAPMGPPSGLWALDVDVERVNPETGEVTPSGEEALALLVDRYGPLPDTLEQRTGGGGRQLLFRWQGERIRNRAGDLGPGLDVRGVKPDGSAGGYVVLPPSPHYSGGTYRWETEADLSHAAPAPAWLTFLCTFGSHERNALADLGIGPADGFGDVPAPEWPERAVALLAEAEAKRAKGVGSRNERPADDGDARARYARAGIEAELAALAATMPGGQDDAMNKAAIQVWGLIKGANLDGEANAHRDRFLAACRRLPNQAGRERWTEKDFTAKWERARRDARPRDLSHVEGGWTSDRSAFGRTESDRPRDGARPGPGPKPSAQPGERLPLFPPLPPAEPYPVAALGPLARAAEAIASKVQVPPALAAQSVLAAASLAVQAHADVVLPFGQTRPLSQFLVTVAVTGGRKSSADSEALWAVRKREKALAEEREEEMRAFRIDHAAWEAERRRIETDKKLDFDGRREALRSLGDEPEPPLLAFLTAADPTVEGLAKAWPNAHPALGIFTAEGGQFTGGHAMSDESRLRSAAALSAMWDGTPIKRARALDGVSVLHGRRLSMHLMLQPDAATDFLSHPTLRDQGLLSRVLVAAPESLAGSRLYRDATPEEDAEVRAYGARLLSILEARPAMAEGKRNELDPRALPLSAEAARLWRAFHDHVERQLAPGEPLVPVQGLAAKAAEHAARIAAVLTLFADLKAAEVGEGAMGEGVTLTGWYLGEAVRLHAAGRTDPALLQANALLGWMQGHADDGTIAFRDVLRLGPNATRKLDAAEAALKVLARHGWVEEVSARPRVVRVWPARDGGGP